LPLWLHRRERPYWQRYWSRGLSLALMDSAVLELDGQDARIIAIVAAMCALATNIIGMDQAEVSVAMLGKTTMNAQPTAAVQLAMHADCIDKMGVTKQIAEVSTQTPRVRPTIIASHRTTTTLPALTLLVPTRTISTAMHTRLQWTPLFPSRRATSGTRRAHLQSPSHARRGIPFLAEPPSPPSAPVT